MHDTLTVARSANRCDLWTPWGPQSATANDRKIVSLRRTLKRLRKQPKVRANKGSDDGPLAPAELS